MEGLKTLAHFLWRKARAHFVWRKTQVHFVWRKTRAHFVWRVVGEEVRHAGRARRLTTRREQPAANTGDWQ